CGNKRRVGNRSRQNQRHQNEVAENHTRPGESAGVTGDLENARADQNSNQCCVRFDGTEVAAETRHGLRGTGLMIHRFIKSFEGSVGSRTFSAVSTPATGNVLASINPSWASTDA